MHTELTSKYNAEVKNALKKCILQTKPDISFADIAGNEYAKEVIHLTFILPTICPYVFEQGKVKPWQSILLYGPPGVGKTMLTQAVCHHSNATCFWVSVSDITSKYIGESEQRLIMLFELAREYAPSIILIDEMDSLGRRRTGNESETERRIKTEFLRQMDQITRIKERVSVFATTNMPWELDIAALRRFQRRVLVPMPNH
jgi:SpoVK/Ycf46/Vps4 family AAA+-type ATPase